MTFEPEPRTIADSIWVSCAVVSSVGSLTTTLVIAVVGARGVAGRGCAARTDAIDRVKSTVTEDLARSNISRFLPQKTKFRGRGTPRSLAEFTVVALGCRF